MNFRQARYLLQRSDPAAVTTFFLVKSREDRGPNGLTGLTYDGGPGVALRPYGYGGEAARWWPVGG